MTDRFEIRLTPARRAELSQFAAEVGISAADCARLAIHQFLHSREGLRRPRIIRWRHDCRLLGCAASSSHRYARANWPALFVGDASLPRVAPAFNVPTVWEFGPSHVWAGRDFAAAVLAGRLAPRRFNHPLCAVLP
jgi:hypothetical protein